MIRLRSLLIVWFGVILLLAACSSTEGELTMEDAEIGEKIVMETAVPTSSEENIPPTNTPTIQPTELAKVNLPNLGPAPEIKNEVWLNTETPVTLASQRGKVVLVEFWTFG